MPVKGFRKQSASVRLLISLPCEGWFATRENLSSSSSSSSSLSMANKRKKTDESITSIMEMIAHSNDLMLEILYRLPVKSVLRFKCVSKHWLSLISNPSFPLNHSFHQPPPDSSISSFFIQPSLSMQLDFTPIDKTNSGVPDPSLSFLGSDFLITQSCNGLLLCRYNEYGKDIAFCICNPTTMEYILLPKLPTIMSKQCISTIAFDPSKSPHYKVICVSDTRQKRIHVSIYSSQTGSWRPSAEAFHEPCLSLREKGVLWNGALHWTSLCESSLSFHVEREFLRTIKLPPELSRSNRVCEYFGESNGHLYLIESYGSGMTEIYIYEMECDYSQWSFRYHVNLDIVFKTYPEKLPLLAGLFYPRINTSREFTLLHLLQGGGEEVLWIYIPGKIILYQIADGNFDKYYDFEHQSIEWPQFHAYSNTLSSIRSLSS